MCVVPGTRAGRVDYLFVESTTLLEVAPRAGARRGRRTALTLPLLPPPQKNRSAPSDSSPDTPTPAASRAARAPLAGSRIDASQLALVTFPRRVPELAIDPGDAGDEAVRIDRAKNRPRLGIDLMDLAIRYCPTQSVPSAQASPESPPPPGAGIVASTRPALRIDLLDAILGELKQVLAVEGRSGMRGDVDRAKRSCRLRDRARSACRRAANQTCCAVVGHAVHAHRRRGKDRIRERSRRLIRSSWRIASLVDRQRRGE